MTTTATTITSITTVTTDTGEPIENTIYPIGAYTLTRFTFLNNGYTYWEIECEDDSLPEVTPMRPDSPEYGVNLDARGDKDTDEATAYANALLEAVEVAETFTTIRTKHESN